MLAAIIVLTRPLNCLITVCSVWVGALTTGAGIRAPAIALAALSAALIAAAGNCHNDLKDLKIDRVNRPLRPLPSGRISPQVAAIETLVLAAAGLGIAWSLGSWTGWIATGVTCGLFIYNVSLKGSMLWGNVLVGCLAGAAFPYGAIAAGSWGRSWIPAVFAALFHLGREIVKDIEDIEGDERENARTLAVIHGPRAAKIAASVVYLLLMAVTLLPALLDIYGTIYLIFVAGLDILLIVTLIRLWRDVSVGSDFRASTALTAGMTLGLLAVVAGELL